MPSFRKLNSDETAAAGQRPISARAQIAQEYDALLAGFAIGEYGRAGLVVKYQFSRPKQCAGGAGASPTLRRSWTAVLRRRRSRRSSSALKSRLLGIRNSRRPRPQSPSH